LVADKKSSILANDDEFKEIDENAKIAVTVELSVKTVNEIDTKRGIVKRGPYLRQLIVKFLPDAPTYPPEED
jgi:hypothetical protein